MLNFGLDVDGLLPDWLVGVGEGSDADDAATAAGFAGKAAATLAVVEAIGPARLALTVAATPRVSERAREFELVRGIEAFALSAWQRITGGAE